MLTCTKAFILFQSLLIAPAVSFTACPQSWHATQSSICTRLQSAFKQMPGESDMDFIKRITSHSADVADGNLAGNSKADDESDKPKAKYVPIEEWDRKRNESGALSWEEKVQFDGQRFGDQVRQDSILRKNLSMF